MRDTSREWYEAFLARLTKRLSTEPSIALNPRCLSERILHAVFDDLEADGLRLRYAKKKITSWLIDIGLLASIPVDYARRPSVARTRFYSFDVAKSPAFHASPLELLQAYAPEGTICYFTAIGFHSLSTQPLAYHHIAIPTEAHVNCPVAKESKQRRRSSASTPKNPLGTALFSYGGLPYYKTSRDARLLRGTQVRYIAPTAIIRITDLEQTLLDTLHRPLHCGGPAVVFEAWDQGIKRLQEDRLANYLASMEHGPTARRVGYMLEDLDYRPHDKLAAVLKRYLSQLDAKDPNVCQQLFPGMGYTSLRQPWLVYGP